MKDQKGAYLKVPHAISQKQGQGQGQGWDGDWPNKIFSAPFAAFP